jgi:hypothetical protein
VQGGCLAAKGPSTGEKSANAESWGEAVEERRGDASNPFQVNNLAKWASAVAKCHDCPGTGRPDPRQGVEIGDTGLIQVDGDVIADRSSIGRHHPEAQVWSEPCQRAWPDTRNPVEARDAAERPPDLAIRHDPFGEGWADPREAGEFSRSCPLRIDPLPRGEGASQRLA